MRKVADILLRKGNKVTTVLPSTSVIEALKIMAEQNIGSVAVMDKEKFLGIMTERDYSRKVIFKRAFFHRHCRKRNYERRFPCSKK